MTPTTEELIALRGRYNLPTDCDCDNEDCVKCAHYPTFQEAAAKQLRALAPDLLDEVISLRAALEAAGAMRDAADRVSEWFCTEARHLEGPRIQALRATMIAYDQHMQPNALEAKP